MKPNLAPQCLLRRRSLLSLLSPHLLIGSRLLGVYLLGKIVGCSVPQRGDVSNYKRSWSHDSPWPSALGHPALHDWSYQPHATRNPAPSLHHTAIRNKSQFVKRVDTGLKMTKLTPPVAARKEHKTDDGRVDYYHWLRDQNWPNVTDSEVINYLNQENEYTEANMPSDLKDRLFNEMKDRVEKSDKTVPYLDNGYYYYSFIQEEQQYWAHARKEVNSDKEEIILDENQLAADKKHLSVSCVRISPDNKIVAYTTDFTGDERYVVYIKDIASGEIIENNVDDVYEKIVWDKLGKGFFYTPAGEFWRPDRIFYHEIGKPKEEDKLLFHEQDVTFSLSVRKSKSQDYIYFISSSSTSTEYRFIPSDSPFQTPEIIHDRSNNHLYNVLHHEDRFFIHINDVSLNYRVVEIPIDGIKDKTFKEFVPASNKYIQDVYVYENHLVLLNRVKGLAKAEIINLKDNKTQKIDIDDESYEIAIIQHTYKDSALRYSYSSLKTPKTILDHDFITGEKKVLKTMKIPSGFDSSKYVLKRIWAKINDEVSVPISLIYHKEKAKLDGSDPLYLYGYGSYGYSVPDNFRPQIFSLVDRGYTYALAHIRGGDELGKAWHETAKFLTKKNTFTDFIKCAEKLIEDKYTSEGNIVIKGVSAGGMLIGACINMRPELFKTAIAVVPFVDVLNTMFDITLPLTPGEFKEWGNPKEEDYYTYIKSYSPYDNVAPQKYPNLFVTAGLSDSRVTYWESAKWVALLRYTKTDDNLLLLKTDMTSGHSGPTGRFEYLKELATEFAFILSIDQE